MATIRSVQVPDTPLPAGHYSQAVVHGGLVYVSGQLPARMETGQIELGSIAEQTELVLANAARILAAAGSGLDRAVQVTLYIASIDDWPAVNAAYARVMGSHRPARAVVPVNPLHHGAGIEIQIVAAARRAAPARRRTRSRTTRPRRRAPRSRR